MLNKIIYTILGFGIAFIFFPHDGHNSSQAVISGASIENTQSNLLAAPELASNQAAPELTAKSALAYDFDSGTVLYSKNLDEKLPIASLTKLMTALVVAEENLNQTITIEKPDQTPIGSILGLALGEQIKAGELLKGMLIPSANDAALTLADHMGPGLDAFVAKMNAKAEALGLNSSHFENPIGWDSDENYSTTLDLMKIVEAVAKNETLMKIVGTREATISSIDQQYVHKLTSTNKLLLDNPEVVGIKTGFTSKALGNLIIMTDHNNRRVVSIVLGSDNREADTEKLLAWLFSAYRW